jgi:hypothetical protein
MFLRLLSYVSNGLQYIQALHCGGIYLAFYGAHCLKLLQEQIQISKEIMLLWKGSFGKTSLKCVIWSQFVRPLTS